MNNLAFSRDAAPKHPINTAPHPIFASLSRKRRFARFCSTSGKGNNVPTLKKPILQYHEEDLAGTKQRWNYRSEIVNARNLDRPHRNIWIAFGLIIIIGFTGFVYVKTMVIEGRKEEMLERERLRREMNLTGSNRRRIGVVD